jgi:glycosyltransferase involved in cell wall biosynthesis
MSRIPGGSEKSAIKLAQDLSVDENFDISIATLKQNRKSILDIPANIPQVNFFEFSNKLQNRDNSIFKIISYFYRIFELIIIRSFITRNKFDLIISFGAGVGCLSYLILLGSNVPQITSERTNPDLRVYKPSLLSRYLRPWIYKNGVMCSVQSSEFQDIVTNLWKIESYVTPNHFEIPNVIYSNKNPSLPILSIASLREEKGLANLLNAWIDVEMKISNELWLVGDFADSNLSEYVLSFGLKNVKMIQAVPDLEELFIKSSLFISTSVFEGYPNALAEAMILGIPTLSTKSSPVVEDWQRNGLCMIIPENTHISITNSILESILNWDKSRQIAVNALRSRNHFSWDNAKPFWLRLIWESLDRR